MKCFVSFCFLFLTFLKSSQAQYPRCFNPNQTPGVCVSIYECQPLLGMIARGGANGQEDRSFLRQSQCEGGIGRLPHVCCTNDLGFRRSFEQQQPRSRQRSTAVTFPSQHQQATRSVKTVQLPSAPVCGGISIENKIYGGDDSGLNEFPWMVLMEYKKKSGGLGLNCAGSLINQRYVLTAAHCVTGAIETQVGPLISVRLGEYDISKKVDCVGSTCADAAIRVGVEEIIPHEAYDDKSTSRHNDIALVRLNRNVKYSNSIRPICLGSSLGPAPDVRAGKKLVVAGWGRTLRTPKSLVKQKLSVPLFDQEQCRKKFAMRNVEVTNSQVCAGGVHAEDSCDGDSGGPLMRFQRNAWVLDGIVSFGVKCGIGGWPAVHTRVASYDDWIRSKIR